MLSKIFAPFSKGSTLKGDGRSLFSESSPLFRKSWCAVKQTRNRKKMHSLAKMAEYLPWWSSEVQSDR